MEAAISRDRSSQAGSCRRRTGAELSLKRKRSTDDDAMDTRQVRPPKPFSHRSASCFDPSYTYLQFQQIHSFSLSEGAFLGLCAYLSVLLGWGYTIPISAYDAFVHLYPRFLEENDTVREGELQQRRYTAAYHCWVMDGRLQSLPPGQILDHDRLSQLSQENPLLFARTEARMEQVVKVRKQQQDVVMSGV